MWQLWGVGELRTEFWWGNIKARDHLENIGADGKILLTLSDPMSDLVRHYDFPVPDAFLDL
jgi:hypothetical protein